jgi:DNA-binding HxlR family transcriptional regulator
MGDDIAETLCPIARAEPIVGDRWTALVLNELMLGTCRFEELQIQTGAAPIMLTSRLKRLERDQLVERKLYRIRPDRYEYHPTAKGRAFGQVLLALRAWSETWCKAENEPVAIDAIHNRCGGLAGLGPQCATCGSTLLSEDLQLRPGKDFEVERNARTDAFKVRR